MDNFKKYRDELKNEYKFDHFTHIDFYGRTWFAYKIKKTLTGFSLYYQCEETGDFIIISFLLYYKDKFVMRLDKQIEDMEFAKNDPEVQAYIKKIKEEGVYG